MEPWTNRYIAAQAQQAAVVYRDPRITEYTEADEVRDATVGGLLRHGNSGDPESGAAPVRGLPTSSSHVTSCL